MDHFDDKDISIVDVEEKAETGVYEHTLKKPFEYEGKTYEKLIFDFERLSGHDYIAIEQEMAMRGKGLVVPEFSSDFLTGMAARSSGVPEDVLIALPLKEFNKIRNKARSFLLN